MPWIRALLCLGVALAAGPRAVGDEALPEVRASFAAADPGPGAAGARAVPRRRLVLLVDYSSSMTSRYDGNDPQGAGKKRWEFLKDKVESYLLALGAKASDFRVEVRFFSDNERVPDSLAAPDLTPDSIARLLQQFPSLPPWGNNTALYRAISETCETLLRDAGQPAATGPGDCLFLLVVSDGEDTASPAAFNQRGSGKYWEQRLSDLRASVPGCQTGVLAVGKEAEDAERNRRYGTLKRWTEPPVPPAPAVVWRLQPIVPPVVAIDRPVRAGERYRIPVTVMPVQGLAAESVIDASVVGDGFKVVAGGELRIPGGGTVVVERLGAAPDGAELLLRLAASTPAPAAPGSALASGSAQRSFRFRPEKMPADPATWAPKVPEYVRVSEPAPCSIAVDNAPGIEWTFVHESGRKLSQPGAAIEQVLDRAGRWTVEVVATSADGVKRSLPSSRRPTIEVIDASCRIEGPPQVPLLEDADFRVKAVGPAKATYRWLVNGVPVAAPGSQAGSMLKWAPSSVGTFRITCEATSTRGGFVFVSQELMVESTIRPAIQLVSPTLITEGDAGFLFEFRVYDLDRISWRIGTAVPKQVDVDYPPGGIRIATVSEVVPASVIREVRAERGRELSVQVDGSGRGGGEVRRTWVVPLSTIDLRPRLTDPPAGVPVEVAVPVALTIELDASIPTVSGTSAGPADESAARLRAFVDSCRAEVSVQGLAPQPPMPLKDGKTSVNFVPMPGGGKEFEIKARIEGPWLLEPRAAVSLGSRSVRTSLHLEVPPSWSWNGSAAPPPATVRIDGSRDEIALIERVEWAGAAPIPPAGPGLPSLSATLAPSGADCNVVTSATCSATVIYRGGISDPVPLQATATLDIAPPELDGVLGVTVGGTAASGRGGGALAVQVPPVIGAVCPGTVRVDVKFAPDDLARFRGVPGREAPYEGGLQVGADETGVWTVAVSAQKPGSSGPVVIGTATYTNLRTLNWLPFLAWIGGALALLSLVCYLFAYRNAPLWQAVAVGFDRRELNTSARFIRPRLAWLDRRRAPSFNLLTKRASGRIADYRLLKPDAHDDPQSAWLFDEEREMGSMIVWAAGRLPRIEDSGRKDWMGDPGTGDGVWKYPVRAYSPGLNRPGESAPLLMRVRKVESGWSKLPSAIGWGSALMMAGVVWYAVFEVL